MPTVELGKNPDRSAIREYIYQKWKTVGSLEKHRDMWYTVDDWAKVLKEETRLDLPSSYVLDGKALGLVVQYHELLKKSGVDNDGPHISTTGLYRHYYSPDKARVATYQWRRPGLPKYDPKPDALGRWGERVVNPFACEHRPPKKKAKVANENSENSTSMDIEEGKEDENEGSNPADDDDDDDDNDDESTLATLLCSDSDSDSDYDTDDDEDVLLEWQLPDGISVYDNSTEAANLFCPRPNQTSYDAIIEQIEICRAVGNNRILYQAVIDGHDVKDYMSDYAQHKTRMQCLHIATALEERLKYCRSKKSWGECCKAAVKICRKANILTANNGDTVEKWYRQFRELRKFPNPSKGKTVLPPFLQGNPEAAGRIQSFAKENLKDLEVRKVREYIVDKLIPKMAKKENKSKAEYLKRYQLTKLCERTVLNWLHALGFEYEVRRKSYYVDGHEKPGTIRYRWKFIGRYLAHERRMFRWIQMTKARAMELAKDYPILLKCGHDYPAEDGKGNTVAMVEYHVDTIDLFQKEMNESTLFGGNLSVRKKPHEKPLISIGQDECIFKQYIFKNKSWTHQGRRVPVPKDEGYGVMISGFISREFGFGLEVSAEDLKKINQKRRGNKYVDEDAAMMINKKAEKEDLTESPFVSLFQYGASAEGYWTYERMVLQVEDCVDCLKVLYPQYDFLLLCDHSCGHDRGQDNGLNAKKMSKGFGGKQPKMHKTQIKAKDGYLGPYPSIFSVGDWQDMVWPEYSDAAFDPAKHGPYWMTPAQRSARRKTVYGEWVDNVEKTCDDLKKDIWEKKKIRVSARTKSKIVEIAKKYDISLTKRERKIVSKGWEGQAKGLEQVLWERGWIDVSKGRKYYSKYGTKDDTGATRADSNLQEIMLNCVDFEEEDTLLQSKVIKMCEREGQFILDRTPKCHCEMAGEGIEYAWGCAKNYYRALDIGEKKGKENFIASVKKSISRDILTTERCRMFSRRARRYMGAYMATKKEFKSTEFLAVDPDMLMKVEQMVKDFKAHRCAMDFDGGFCRQVIENKSK